MSRAINRRRLLKGAAASAVAMTAAAPADAAILAHAEVEADTPVLRLFRQWVALYVFTETETVGMEGVDELVDQQMALADRMAEIDICGPQDFAAKYLALTCFGSCCIQESWEGVAADDAARALGTTVAALMRGKASVSIARPEVMPIFRQWEAVYRSADDTTDDLADAAMDECRRLEATMMPIQAVTAADFAAKIIVATSYGGFTLGDDMLAEAERLIASSVAGGAA